MNHGDSSTASPENIDSRSSDEIQDDYSRTESLVRASETLTQVLKTLLDRLSSLSRIAHERTLTVINIERLLMSSAYPRSHVDTELRTREDSLRDEHYVYSDEVYALAVDSNQERVHSLRLLVEQVQTVINQACSVAWPLGGGSEETSESNAYLRATGSLNDQTQDLIALQSEIEGTADQLLTSLGECTTEGDQAKSETNHIVMVLGDKLDAYLIEHSVEKKRALTQYIEEVIEEFCSRDQRIVDAMLARCQSVARTIIDDDTPLLLEAVDTLTLS